MTLSETSLLAVCKSESSELEKLSIRCKQMDLKDMAERLAGHAKTLRNAVTKAEVEPNAELLECCKMSLPFVEHRERVEANANDVATQELMRLRRLILRMRAAIAKAAVSS